MVILELNSSLQIQRLRIGKDLGKSPGPSNSCDLRRDPKRHNLTLCKLVKLRIRTTKSSPKVFRSKKSQRCAWSPSQLVLKPGVSTWAFYPPSTLMNIFSLAECTQYLQKSTAMTLWLCTYTWGEVHYTIAFTSFSLGFLSTFSEYQTKEKLLLKKRKRTNYESHPYFKSNFTSAQNSSTCKHSQIRTKLCTKEKVGQLCLLPTDGVRQSCTSILVLATALFISVGP